MSKRMKIQPDWLDNLLLHWATASFKSRGSLGFPGVSPMFSERVQFKATSREPFELTRDDYDDVSIAVSELQMKHRLAITRYYKPWTLEAITRDCEAFAVSERTWQNWCHAAARELAQKLETRVNTPSQKTVDEIAAFA